jgi:cation transport ATPase
MTHEENGYTESTQNYTEMTDSELESLFNNAETDSEDYHTLMQELIKRGFSFEPAGDELTEIEDSDPKDSSLLFLRYSKGGSLAWNLAAFVFAIAGASFFLYKLSEFGKIEQKLYLMVFVVALLIVSLSYIISGIRNLANHKGIKHPKLPILAIEYAIFCTLWTAATGYGIYSAVQSFLRFSKYNTEVAAYVSLPAVVMTLFAFGMAFIFFLLTKELRK